MEILQGIFSRRSIRRYSSEEVVEADLLAIVRAGAWAPSGLNNQPWRFVICRDAALREALAGLTRYGRIVRQAPAVIAVFLDREVMYHEMKDHQAMGACLQNMLLAAHGLGLGAVWLGLDSGYKSDINLNYQPTASKTAIQGLLYIGQNLNASGGGGGNTRIYGTLYVLGTVSMGSGSQVTVYYNKAAAEAVKTLKLNLKRVEWQAYKNDSPF